MIGYLVYIKTNDDVSQIQFFTLCENKAKDWVSRYNKIVDENLLRHNMRLPDQVDNYHCYEYCFWNLPVAIYHEIEIR